MQNFFYDDDDDELDFYESPVQAALNTQKKAALKSKELAEEIEVFRAETSPETTEFAQKIADVWSKKMESPSLNRVLAAYKGKGLNAKTLKEDLIAKGLTKSIVNETVRMYNSMGKVGPK